MEQTMSYPAETNSSVYLDRKRKIQAELLGMPFSKHVCWDQSLKNESLKVDIDILARGSDSSPESAVDSNSFNNDTDSAMSAYDEEETYSAYSKDEPCTSSSSWGVASSEIDLYSLDSRSLTTSKSKKRGSLSITEDHCCPSDDREVIPSLSYEEHFLEFGSHGDSCCAEYKNDAMESGIDKEFGNLLQAYGIAPTNYASLPEDEDTQQGSKNLTIDKEFEQYFSMLMM